VSVLRLLPDLSILINLNQDTMVLTTHIAVTTLAAKCLHLDGHELAIAYMFGVLVDLDHFYGVPKMVKERELSFKNTNFQHRLPIAHSVTFLPIVVIACVELHNLIPLIFWLLHVGLDAMQRSPMSLLWPVSSRSFEKGVIPLETRYEWILSGALLVFSMVWIFHLNIF
jgi:hypothetical protein